MMNNAFIGLLNHGVVPKNTPIVTRCLSCTAILYWKMRPKCLFLLLSYKWLHWNLIEECNGAFTGQDLLVKCQISKSLRLMLKLAQYIKYKNQSNLQEQKNNSAKKKAFPYWDTVLGNVVFAQISCITLWAVLLKVLCMTQMQGNILKHLIGWWWNVLFTLVHLSVICCVPH